ncbi:peptidase domain-containing ABC transporter [Bradyrhizobium elkanii]|uniref:peptidase domain-containing ABC transporter n=1 Tax=Bradyrhizobium elkanii TaxID=29448 RepID=UPI001AE8B452|nr:peptidase domain-containing ABC transporter [Bradyrhizobium elkanii]MBP2434250.1 ATP-binding cassette subfamily B protein [Bradyrhizobium elkanii]WLA88844.1 peptidase domain-containing ABC transporter [Bradyrhizobium elkanii]
MSSHDTTDALKSANPPGTVVSAETALACLFRLAAQNGVYADVATVRRRNLIEGETLSVSHLIELAGEFGLNAKRAQFDWQGLQTTPFSHPILLLLRNDNVVSLVGLRREGPDEVALSDPLFRDGEPFFLPREELEKAWQGHSLVVTQVSPSPSDATFGFSWFTRKLFAERSLMRDVVFAALVMHVIALSVPISFQILVDKVVPNQAMSTLTALSIGVSVLIFFDAGFNYLRNYLLAFITHRLDRQVSNDTIDHLLKLPIDYFHANPSGVVAHRLQEANNVREFLASRLFNTFLDFLAVFIYLPVLLIYSWKLTLIVLGVAMTAFVVLASMSRGFRRKLNEVNEIEGRRKAFLFEILNGITTIKSLALEPRSMLRWRRYTHEAAIKTLSLDHTAATARSLVNSLERGMSIGVGALGALFVISDQMTVGALIAFNMLGVRLVQPLIQASSLMQDYQRAVLSLKLFAQLMQTAPEPSSGQLAPAIRGEIEFADVTFHYPGSPAAAIKGVSFTIEPGQTVGIVGRSGSGKTTITRLIHGLYRPQAGLVKIDGQDIKELDLAHLRNQVGVVLQENFLFRATVRENIAMTKPTASLDEVVRAARLAGAHEFIERLPHGYSTMLEESAGNLSGGQRQRLAIARALIHDPPVLVFDEATSSLDPESEAVIQQHLSAISRGRTIVIVTHRLSFVARADKIIVVEQGNVVQTGVHEALLGSCLPYKQLWNQQARVYQ